MTVRETEIHSEKEILQALTFIEIFNKDEEIDCRGCGFNTCREFASAMLDGKARPSMCTALSKKIIDKLKKKEKELRETVFFHQEIIDAIPVPVLYEDTEGKSIGCNKAFENFFCIGKDRISGKNISEYLTDKEFAAASELMNNSLKKTPVKQVLELKFKISENIFKTIEYHKAVFANRYGGYGGYISIFFDVTDRALEKEELLKARNTAELSVSLLKKMPSGFVISDNDLKIVDSNSSFAQIMGNEIVEISEVNPGLKGADLKIIFQHHPLFTSFIQSGEENFTKDINFNGKKLKLSLFSIREMNYVGAIILDMTIPEVRNEEVRKRAEAVIKENVETVRKIAYLLGENASKTENVLSSVIELFGKENE